MSELAKSNQVNFEELVRNSTVTLSFSVQSDLIHQLTSEFTEEEQQWYVANLYIYMNYHPTDDYPINLETVYKMIGFANKGNAMKTIKNNFIEGEDYKVALFHTEKRKNEGGFNKEDVMLNIDTFKNLCMLAKTERGKSIRKYYLKLETIYNQIIKKEIDEQKKMLEDQKKLVEEQKKQIELLENKPKTEGFKLKFGNIYIIWDSVSKCYKIGLGEDIDKRLYTLNIGSSHKSLQLLHTFETKNTKVAEKIIHLLLEPFRIQKRNDESLRFDSAAWFYFDQAELNYVIHVIRQAIELTDRYTFETHDQFKNFLNDLPEEKVEHKEPRKKITNTNFLKRADKLSKYNGVSWCIQANNWMARLTKDNETIFLGNYESETEAGCVVNDYAGYLNQTAGANYQMNEIDGYIPNYRDIPAENLKKKYENKTSDYHGVYFIRSKQIFEASIHYKKKKYPLIKDINQVECAKKYNEQALYFNNHLSTNYRLNNIPDFVTEEKNHIADLELTKKKKYSRFIGVSYRSDCHKFRVSIKHNRKTINIGTFASEIQAALAYNRKAEELNALETTKFKYALNQLDD